MTKGEAIELFANLNKLGGLTGVKFSYAVAKNAALLKEEIESIQKASEASEEFKVVDAGRVAICEKYAEKDENGEFKKQIVNGREQYVFNKENEVLNENEVNEYKEKYKEVYDEREKQAKEIDELLKTESSVTLYKVPLDYVPEGIKTEQMYGIMAIIDESMPSPFISK